MSRSVWKWIALGLVFLAVLGVGAYYGLQMYIEQRNQKWLEEADAAYGAGEWQLAKNHYERYLPQDPANISLLLRYAHACRQILTNRVSALQSAAVAYQQVLTHDPENLDVRSQLLDLYEDMGAWGNIEYYTNEWLNAEPENGQLLYLHALALDRLGRRDEAIDEYRALVEANTGYSETYANLSRLLRDRGMDIEGKAVLRDAVERRPRDAQVRIDYARLLARDRDWDRVDALLAESYELAPENPQVLIAQAQAAGLREEYGDVITFLNKAIEANPKDATSHLMLAGAYVAMNELNRAVDVLENVAPLVQIDNPAVLITLGDLQLSLRKFDDAHQTLERYSNAYPGQLPVEEYFAAKEALMMGNPQGAIERLGPVLELRPNFLQAQYTLAVAYLDAGEYELARNTLDAYLARNPSDVRARELLVQNYGEPIPLEATIARANQLMNDSSAGAEALFAAGAALFGAAESVGELESYRDTARTLLQRSIESDSSQSQAYHALIELEMTAGRGNAAREVLQKAIDSGIPESDLAQPRAALAFADGDRRRAREIIADSMAKSSTPIVDAYTRWAQFLSLHGEFEEASALLDDGIATVPSPEQRTELSLVKASFMSNHGDNQEALALIRTLDTQIPLASSTRKRFNVVRLDIAQHLLAESTRENDELVRSIVAAVRREDPEHPVLKTIDGFFLLREDPPAVAKAKAMFESAAASNQRDVNAQWGLARVATIEQDYPRALEFAERAAALAPEIRVLQLQLGEILSKMGRRLEAENVLKRVLDADPQNTRALQLLIENLIERRQVRQARDLLTRLERANALSPEEASALQSLRSRILLSEGNAGAAERLLRDQVEANPDNVAMAANLARAIYDQGRTTEAVDVLQRFARSHSSDPEAWISLALLYLDDGGEESLDEASTALTRALLADPNSIPALRAMLNVRIRQGNVVEAIGLCDRYLEKNPDNAEILNTKALILSETPGQLDAAREIIDRVIAVHKRPDYLATRGIILLRNGDARRALEDLQSAASAMAATPARVDLALAEAYYETRDFESAQRYYELAVQKSSQGDPVNSVRLVRLGELLKSQDSVA